MDSLLGELGPPRLQYSSGLPDFVRENATTYPQLYEFMSRYAFKNAHTLQSATNFVQESMSAQGIPTLTVLFGNFSSSDLEAEILAYKFLKIYSRIWSAKHYLILDCTNFHKPRADSKSSRQCCVL